jgi:hypothetical protein
MAKAENIAAHINNDEDIRSAPLFLIKLSAALYINGYPHKNTAAQAGLTRNGVSASRQTKLAARHTPAAAVTAAPELTRFIAANISAKTFIRCEGID